MHYKASDTVSHALGQWGVGVGLVQLVSWFPPWFGEESPNAGKDVDEIMPLARLRVELVLFFFAFLLLFTLILLHSFGLATFWTSLFIDLRQLQAQLAAAHARVAKLEAQAAQDEPLGSEAGYT